MEWVLADLAIYRSAAVVVPVYDSVSLDDAVFHIQDSGMDVIFVDDEGDRIQLLGKRCPDLKIISIQQKEGFLNIPDIIKLDQKIASFPDLKKTDLASIVYTSGTSGTPKGVCISHQNFLENIADILEVFPLKNTDCVLSFLPLAHVFERTAGYYVALAAGVSIYYAESPYTVAEDILIAKPTLLIAVPRFFEKIHHKIIEKSTGLKSTILRWALNQGQSYYIDQKKRVFKH